MSLRNQVEKVIKGSLKRKAKITMATLVVFAITGNVGYAVDSNTPLAGDGINIVINNNSEKTGIQLGDNSRAREEGSIATARNSIAIGKNAVATGGNETKETIKAKLAENQAKLDEIAAKEKEISAMTKEIQDLQERERETIEAGIRVEQIRKAKAKAKVEYDRLKQEHQDLVDGSAEFFREHQAKIDDLNSRLTGLGNITGFDIQNENDLTQMATAFKTQTEQGTTLDLSVNFYKEYITNYYKALGELRKNEKVLDKFDDDMYSKKNNNMQEDFKIGTRYREFVYYKAITFKNDSKYNHNIYSGGSSYDYFSYSAQENSNPILYKTFLGKSAVVKLPNIDTDVVDDDTMSQDLKTVYEIVRLTKLGIDDNTDIFVDEEIKNEMKKILDIKVKIYEKSFEITNYQYKYEKTKDVSWLDKKKQALQELQKIDRNFKNVKELRLANKREWEQKNITDVKNKNRITTDKLTAELEKALGINKNAIKEREKQIADKLAESEQAKRNWEGINPTEKDLILAREYERVRAILLEKGKILKTASDRLQYLKDNLTLNDLRNVGADSIAVGTDTIASGNASIALGKSNISTKENATAVGQTNLVDSKNSQAIGVGNNLLSKDENTVSENQGTLGNTNTLIGNNNYVVGMNNTVGTQENPKEKVFILGSNVDASAVSNAVVLGDSSTAVENSVSFGSTGKERQLKFVKAGVEDTDGVNVSQLKLTYTNKDDGKEIIKKPDGTFVLKEDGTTVIPKEKVELVGKDGIDIKGTGGDTSNLLNKDLSNLSDTLDTTGKNKLKTKLSENANLDNPTGDLVTDTLVKAKLDTMKTENDGKYLKLDGTNTNSITDTLKTNLSDKLSEGASTTKPTGALVDDNLLKSSLDGVKDGLDRKANKDASNIDDTAKTKWQEKLDIGNGTIGGNKDNNTVTGTTVKNFVEGKGYLTENSLTGTMIDGKIAKGSLLGDSMIKVEGDGKVLKSNLNLSINDNSITNNKIKDATITGDKIANNTITENKLDNSLKTKLDGLAKTDASNINKDKFTEKLNEGANLDKPSNKLVTDTQVKNKLDSIKTENDGKYLKLDGTNTNNITDTLKTNLSDKLSEGASVTTPTGALVNDTLLKSSLDNVKDGLDGKLNKDGSNLDKASKGKLSTKLSEGANLSKPTGTLVTDTQVKAGLDKKLDKGDLGKFEGSKEISVSNGDLTKGNITIGIKDGSIGKNKLDKGLVAEIETKANANLNGEITATEERGVRGKVIHKELALRDKAIAKNAKEIGELNNEVKATTAMTGALAALKPMQFDPRQKTQIMAGVGSYKNNQAIAVGMAHYFNENFMMNAGLSAGTGYKNNYVANAGFTLKLGSKDDRKDYPERYEAGSTQANYQMQLEIENLKREIRALKNK